MHTFQRLLLAGVSLFLTAAGTQKNFYQYRRGLCARVCALIQSANKTADIVIIIRCARVGSKLLLLLLFVNQREIKCCATSHSQFASPLYKLVFPLLTRIFPYFLDALSHSVLSHDCQLQFKTRRRFEGGIKMPLFISAYQQVGPAKSDARKWLRERKNGASERVDSFAVNFIKFRLVDLRRCSKRV
jgi:hypothetical protein